VGLHREFVVSEPCGPGGYDCACCYDGRSGKRGAKKHKRCNHARKSGLRQRAKQETARDTL